MVYRDAIKWQYELFIYRTTTVLWPTHHKPAQIAISQVGENSTTSSRSTSLRRNCYHCYLPTCRYKTTIITFSLFWCFCQMIPHHLQWSLKQYARNCYNMEKTKSEDTRFVDKSTKTTRHYIKSSTSFFVAQHKRFGLWKHDSILTEPNKLSIFCI